LKSDFINNYVSMVSLKLSSISSQTHWSPAEITNARTLFMNVVTDIGGREVLGQQKDKIEPLRGALATCKETSLISINRDLTSKIGFPISLKAQREASLKDVLDSRRMLKTLKTELSLPIWESENPASLKNLRKSCDDYLPIINMLVSDTDEPTKWELYFVPPESPDDRTIVSVYRFLKTTIEGAQSIDDLTRIRQPVAVGKKPAGDALTLTFQKSSIDASSATNLVVKDWWLPRMVRDSGDHRGEVLGAWRFRIPLADPSQKNSKGEVLSGLVTFEARPADPKAVLIKYEDWAR